MPCAVGGDGCVVVDDVGFVVVAVGFVVDVVDGGFDFVFSDNIVVVVVVVLDDFVVIFDRVESFHVVVVVVPGVAGSCFVDIFLGWWAHEPGCDRHDCLFQAVPRTSQVWRRALTGQ